MNRYYGLTFIINQGPDTAGDTGAYVDGIYVNNDNVKIPIKWPGGTPPTVGTSTDIETVNLLYFSTIWTAFGTYNSYT